VRPNPITGYRGQYGREYSPNIEFDGRPTVVRYGWPDSYWWTTSYITRHFHTVGYRFMPAAQVLDTLHRTGDEAWSVDVDFSEHLRYGGGYGLGLDLYDPRWARFENVDHQTARFRRGEDVLLVSKPSAVVSQSELGYALFTEVGESEDPPRHDVARVDTRGRGVFLVTIPPQPQLLALESWTEGLARRTRFGTGELDSLLASTALSDLLLFEGPAPAQPQLDDVLDVMLATRNVRRDTIGLYWEIYGLEAGTPAAMRVRLERPERGGLAGWFSWLPFVSAPAGAPEVRWTFAAEPNAEGIQAMSISMPFVGVEPGTYTLSLTCECGGRRVETSRTITIVAGG
jgi:hypothetical protein